MKEKNINGPFMGLQTVRCDLVRTMETERKKLLKGRTKTKKKSTDVASMLRWIGCMSREIC
jgi:hypothetical protein